MVFLRLTPLTILLRISFAYSYPQLNEWVTVAMQLMAFFEKIRFTRVVEKCAVSGELVY